MAFPNTLVLDNFNISDQEIAGQGIWSANSFWGDSSLQVVSNQLERTTNTSGNYTTDSFDRTQNAVELYITCITVSAGSAASTLFWCLNGNLALAPQGYLMEIWPDILVVFARQGGYHTLKSIAITLSDGDSVGVSHDSLGVIRVYHKIGAGDWDEVGSVSDTRYTSGPFAVEVGDDAVWDNFGGGLVFTAAGIGFHQVSRIENVTTRLRDTTSRVGNVTTRLRSTASRLEGVRRL